MVKISYIFVSTLAVLALVVLTTWIKKDMQKTLKLLENLCSKNFMQIPFIAKNQIVLFMYSDNIFKTDELTEKVRNVLGVESADLFIPKKILLPQEWILNEIKIAKNSPKLHLVYQTH